MSKQKQIRFKKIKTFKNVYQYHLPKLHKKNFNNFIEKNKKENRPLIIELACGKADFSLQFAKNNLKKDILAIDIKGDRLFLGAKKAINKKINNLFFLRTDIINLNQFLPKDCIDKIWITFPDPYPKRKHSKHRLTNIKFLKLYQKILKSKHTINLKTDNFSLINYSLKQIKKLKTGKIIKKNIDIYNQTELTEPLTYKTEFEKKYLKNNRKIHYLCFSV
jgi:tRNA (guanine-N7-)-methyltransferase